MFPGAASTGVAPQISISVEELEEDRFRVRSDLKEVPAELSRVELPIWLAEEVTEALIAKQKRGDRASRRLGCLEWTRHRAAGRERRGQVLSRRLARR